MADEERWAICDWKTDIVKTMVLSFLQNCPLAAFPEQGGASPPEPDDLVVSRFQDSYMNHVIRVRLKKRPAAGFIVKMAPPCMQCPGRVALSAPVERGEMEYRAYDFFNTVVPACAPTTVFYDSTLHILCTWELSGYTCLTEELLSSRCSVSGARSLVASLASLHAATHIITLGIQGLNNLRQQFPTLEAMVSLIRIFHYERPFDPADPGKRCAKDVLLMLHELYDDSTIMAVKDKVKQRFVETAECLIHGDLHIDSVIVKDNDFKMVDAEFVRVGPCAYDMGLLVATLVLIYQHHRHNHVTATSPASCATRMEDEVTLLKDTLVTSVEPLRVADREGQPVCHSGGYFHGSCQNVCQVPDVVGSSGQCCSCASHESHADATTAVQRVLAMISEMLYTYTSTLKETLKQNEVFTLKLVQEIAAFAGCEILSCVIGPSHFDFLDSSPPAQVECVRTALALLRKVEHITTVSDLVDIIAQSQ